MSNPNNAAPSTAAKKEAKKGLRRYTSLIAMIVLFLVFTVATLAFSAWVTVQQTQTGKELLVKMTSTLEKLGFASHASRFFKPSAGSKLA